ncbi:S8 family serine peptidase [Solwaraspora sp. WMMD1047]|uniref:S8 family serine peptidase n=1 Tax=Solwaraspora sp. WMMD1047 TaxID=3016102 RepID=UPI002417565D|nr:S8 family serine peptidase [Solwaraspora sp. WMMD1047]MDG4828041.1 S8 family serine peptidase [Solwaraspora sp. WMMD1047]
MRDPKWLRAGIAAALLPPLAVVAWAAPAAAAPAGDLTATPIAVKSREEAAKAPTSRLAETDRSLLGRKDAEPVAVLVKLDHDPVATYAGGVDNLAATSPAVTGRKLTGSAPERSYENYLARQEAEFVADLDRAVPGADVGQRLRTVYGGVSATVPANKISDLLKIDGVVAVQKDELRQPLTDSSTEFIGADSLNDELGGASNAGEGVIFGVLDSGAWPEHPSFADQGNLSAPPGPARTCDFGDNPLTPETDVFECNNKLIGGQPFIDTYNAAVGGEVYPDSARDSDGHGTHTGTTTAGNVIDNAPIFGVERGPARGVAPGAWVSIYKVCGTDGCFSSDSAAAVAQAVLDGVNVINFSISGGANPFSDPVELAFLDAYAAGVFVATSAGNSGPGAATTNHVSPWVTTVAASTQTREFSSTLTLKSGTETLVLRGASVTAGVPTDTPVVMASAAPYGDALCQAPAPAGSFAGKIVACQRGVTSRVSKGYNVAQGGAVGMILYNPSLADTNTDNHWLPTVHLADGTEFVAWMGSHSGVTASFTAGQKRAGQGDVMAAFSSRGPGGFGIKPDITAPGVQILAGHTPTPDTIDGGPPGEFFQAIAGTSMSSPHIAGAAVLMKALHPTWTPGQIKSALMTTATQDVVKEDLTTPADPFDYGSGRVDLTTADNPGLTFDETAERMLALGNDPVNAVHLNLPSVNAPVMPGKLTTVRTATNVTNRTQSYRVSASAPAKSKITVSPSSFSLAPGRSVNLKITISSTAPTAQVFGEVKLDATRAGLPTLHLPVAFVPQQGDVALTSSCGPAQITWFGKSTCTVTATNNSFGDATVDLKSTANLHLLVSGVNGARKTSPWTVEKKDVALAGAQPGDPSLSPGTIAGYLPLAAFGIAPEAVADETILNYDVPGFVYGGQTYTSVGVTSNGYLVVGGGTSQDVEYDPPAIPDPSRPNNVLAPFWTDLNGTGAQGIRIGTLTDGVDTWLVVEWNVFVYGTTSNRTFQVWIGVNGTEDIAYAYNPAALPALPAAQATVVGAENVNGTGGDQLPAGTAPTQDLRVTSSDPVPGASVSYTVQVTGVLPGTGVLATSMDADTVPGTTQVSSNVEVRFRTGGFLP